MMCVTGMQDPTAFYIVMEKVRASVGSLQMCPTDSFFAELVGGSSDRLPCDESKNAGKPGQSHRVDQPGEAEAAGAQLCRQACGSD